MPPQPIVRIHYLGHAAFLLCFDNGFTVLTDYGQSNAYGLDSPINDSGAAAPDVVTVSHDHPDHARPGTDFGPAKILTGTESLSLDGLEITPIRTCEASVHAADNSSYLFAYKGLKILHLADAQAYITAVGQDEVRQQIRALYPDRYDLLLMTIEGIRPFIPQAEEFIHLLQPARVIPMHYWSPAYKADFLAYLESRDGHDGRQYTIQAAGGPEYELCRNGKAGPMQVISLDPGPFTGTK